MDYLQNYLKATKISDEIREGARQGKKVKLKYGLASRKEVKAPAQPSPVELQLQAINDIRMSFDNLDLGEPVMEKSLGDVRPRARSDVIPDNLKSDPSFMSEIKKIAEKQGFPESELYRLIQGESAFNPKALNKSSKAAGMFQFIPAVAEELGTTTDDILNMSPTQQLSLYDKYLDRWNYKGTVPLAVMHAAPALANKSPDSVAYKKGSKAWEQNPGWRPKDGGDITLKSITEYYRGQ